MPVLELKTLVKSDLETCFDLSRSIDFHQLSTSKTNEKAVAGRTSGLIEMGETVTWEATHFGMRQRLTSKITAYDRPYHFRDEQVKGAFKSIRHDHYFEYVNGEVLMTDTFEFEAPFGILGKWFNKLLLSSYMMRFLVERNQLIKAFSESGAGKEYMAKFS